MANALAGLELLRRVAQVLDREVTESHCSDSVLGFAVFFLLSPVIALLALNRNEMDAFDLRPLNRLDTILAQL